MGKSRIDRPLTAEERELAARAYKLARPVAINYARKWRSYDVDWSGEIAVRLCRMIPSFDPRLSSLKTWAICHANFACKEAIRSKASGNPDARKRSNRLRFVSLDNEICDGSGHTFAGSIEGPGLPGPFEHSDAANLLRGLSPIQRTSVWDSFVADRPLHEIAREHGVSESRISQVRAQALEFLRSHRAAEACA